MMGSREDVMYEDGGGWDKNQVPVNVHLPPGTAVISSIENFEGKLLTE